MLGPIFVREWLTLPRRARHYAVRTAYLGFLWVLAVTAGLRLLGWSRSATLGETARFGLVLFQVFAYVQLALFLFFAAVSAAAAVAQEKDRRTFVLLLLTDMRNYEIVLGKLFGSLLQIAMLLIGTLPILALTMLLGGVAPNQVIEAAVILAATALAAGSLGCFVALWREQTFQTLALTGLLLVLYLCLARAVVFVPTLISGWLGAERLPAFLQPGSWDAVPVWLDPFQALQRVLDPPVAADDSAAPALGFAATMVGLSAVLNFWAVLRLRVWNPSGEPVMQREASPDKQKEGATVHAAPGAVRQVGANPILWREVRTRAYGRRPLLVKAAYLLVLGLIGYYALAPLANPEERPAFAAAYGLLPVTVLSLLLIAAQAVTTITSERDRHTLDLLLVTDLTPWEFIFGKLGGICVNSAVFALPPLLLAGLYAYLGLLATPPRGHPELGPSRNLQSLVCVLGTLLVLAAFVVVFGLHVGLRNESGRTAIVNTLGTVFFLSVGTLVCIALIGISGRFEYQWGSFVFFVAAGVGGLWWVLNGDRPSTALLVASWACPLAMFYGVMKVLIGKPGVAESSDPFLPFLVILSAFGFTIAAMLMPLLSEFDLALGRTGGGNE